MRRVPHFSRPLREVGFHAPYPLGIRPCRKRATRNVAFSPSGSPERRAGRTPLPILFDSALFDCHPEAAESHAKRATPNEELALSLPKGPMHFRHRSCKERDREGHDFSRAANVQNEAGLQPLRQPVWDGHSGPSPLTLDRSRANHPRRSSHILLRFNATSFLAAQPPKSRPPALRSAAAQVPLDSSRAGSVSSPQPPSARSQTHPVSQSLWTACP